MNTLAIRRAVSMKPETIGLYLRAWRESKGYSLRDLAKIFGTSHVAIIHLENERYAYPTSFLKHYYPLMTNAEKQGAKDLLINQLKQELEE